jgi:hypothetical protein
LIPAVSRVAPTLRRAASDDPTAGPGDREGGIAILGAGRDEEVLGLLDSPHVAVRQAAKDALEEIRAYRWPFSRTRTRR